MRRVRRPARARAHHPLREPRLDGDRALHLLGDLRFVLGLHESAVVGMATGWALGRREPALAVLHTTPGLATRVSALATARVNRSPSWSSSASKDRRHLPASRS